jgi:hypothetical protein
MLSAGKKTKMLVMPAALNTSCLRKKSIVVTLKKQHRKK